MLHETGEVGYGLKSLLVLRSSPPALHLMLPTSQPQQDPLAAVVFAGSWAVEVLGVFSSAGLNRLPVREEGQEPPWLGT